MYGTALPSDPFAVERVPNGLRARGKLFVEARALGARTVPGRIEEAGSCRVRFPSSGRRSGALEAVMLNIGGGIAGGDASQTRLELAPNARLVVTTQAAEKVYRSDGASSHISVQASVAAGASLEWMPQATILFDEARLERSIDLDIDPSSRLLLIEPVVLGRTARGERFTNGRLFDRWRVRRGGRLIYADAFHLDGNLASMLDRRAVTAGLPAFATVLLVAPDAEARIDAVREALGLSTGEQPDDLPPGVEAGASAWDGMLSVRLLAESGDLLDRAIRRLIGALGVAEPPRIWHS